MRAYFKVMRWLVYGLALGAFIFLDVRSHTRTDTYIFNSATKGEEELTTKETSIFMAGGGIAVQYVCFRTSDPQDIAQYVAPPSVQHVTDTSDQEYPVIRDASRCSVNMWGTQLLVQRSPSRGFITEAIFILPFWIVVVVMLFPASVLVGARLIKKSHADRRSGFPMERHSTNRP